MPITKTARTVSLLIVGIGLAINGYSQSFLTNGLVAYYPFNGNANDASGNGVNGSVQGAVLTTNRFGNPNQAYLFSGASTYITAPFSTTVLSSDFTASVWFNAFDIANGWPTLLSVQSVSSSEIWPLDLEIAGTRCGCGHSGSLNAASGYAPGTASWQLDYSQQTPLNVFKQVAITKAGTIVKMYLNGQIVATNQVVNPTVVPGNPLYIGDAQARLSSGDWAFHGVLDDIRIYNRALSSNEVAQLYAIESGPRVDLIKAVKPSFSYLWVGTNYQLQLSADMNTWTNHGSPFTATNTSMVYPQYWDVANWGTLFFRLQTTP